MEYTKLANGMQMPMLGYGVFQIDDDTTERCVSDALAAGYRLIDTAQAYMNERGVGAAIAKSGVAREDIFLVDKVWVSNYGEGKTYDSIKASLELLGLDYIDACEIIGLNQESPINTGFRRFSPFSLTRKQEKFHKRRRQYAQSRNLSAKRRAAVDGGVFSCPYIQTDISFRRRS